VSRREKENLLNTKTRPTSLGESDQVPVQILASRFGFEPALWAEDVRVREDVGVVVERVGGCSNSSL
jgi:hypothetical protein